MLNLFILVQFLKNVKFFFKFSSIRSVIYGLNFSSVQFWIFENRWNFFWIIIFNKSLKVVIRSVKACFVFGSFEAMNNMICVMNMEKKKEENLQNGVNAHERLALYVYNTISSSQ